MREADKGQLVDIAKDLVELGFDLIATRGSARIIEAAGLAVETINKVQEGRPDVRDMLKNRSVDFIINTTEGKQAIADSFEIRRLALQYKVCYTTTMAGGRASIAVLQHGEESTVYRLQDLLERDTRRI